MSNGRVGLVLGRVNLDRVISGYENFRVVSGSGRFGFGSFRVRVISGFGRFRSGLRAGFSGRVIVGSGHFRVRVISGYVHFMFNYLILFHIHIIVISSK